MAFNIVHNHGHVELYIDGKFYCTADNFSEAIREYNNYVKEGLNVNESKNSSTKVRHNGTV